MRFVLYTLLLLLCFLFTGGCDESTHNSREELLAGVKIGQLKPIGPGVVNPVEVNFRVISFHIPAEKANLLDSIFGKLQQGPLRFFNYKAFIANELIVGFGRGEMWNALATQFEQAQVTRQIAETLIIFDEGSEMLFPIGIYSEQTFFYKDARGNITGRGLVDGQIGWQISARKAANMKGIAEIQMVPVFVSNTDRVMAHLSGSEEVKKEAFDFGKFSAIMGEGDFILLGPSSYSTDKITLSSVFFNSPNEGGFIRLYLIVCARVG